MKRADSCKVWFAQLDRLREEFLLDESKGRKLRTTLRREISQEEAAKHRGKAARSSKVKRTL
jgi:hypothetical protein